MGKLRRLPQKGNHDLALFAWAERQFRDGTHPAARRLAKRYRLLPATAIAIADAFGIGGDH